MEDKMLDYKVKKRIEELEKQIEALSKEIIQLEKQNKGYWIGIGDNDFSVDYYRLGWCTENKAKEIMAQKGNFVLGFTVEEVTKEYNTKMYKAEKIQNIISLLDDNDFSDYKEMKESLKEELCILKSELNIPEISYIS